MKANWRSEGRIASIFLVGDKQETSLKQTAWLTHDPEGGDDIFLRNIRCLSADCTPLYPKRRNTSYLLLREPQIQCHILSSINFVSIFAKVSP
jgi:hypothetical protein